MSETFSDSLSPNFSNPPVVETVLAVQANDIRSLTCRDFIEFWQDNVRDRFSCEIVVDAPRLDRIFEPKRLEPMPTRFEFMNSPLVARYMMSGENDPNRRFQMQSDRLAINWMTSPTIEYLRFRDLAPVFMDFINSFQNFCIERANSRWVPDLYEVTYVNRIKGVMGMTPSDVLSEYLVGFDAHNSDDKVLIEESMAISRTYVSPMPNEGRVHVQVAQEASSGPPSFLVNIVSRLHARPEDQTITDALKVAHDNAVRTFMLITKKESHLKWGLNSNG